MARASTFAKYYMREARERASRGERGFGDERRESRGGRAYEGEHADLYMP